MEFNTEIRRKQLESLDQFISSSKDRVDSILDYLGWSAQKITETQKEMVKCMINPNHRISASAASSHMQKCAWQKEKYDKVDLPLSEPNLIPNSTIIIDDMTKVNVLNSALTTNPHMKTGWRSSEPVPKTSNRLISTFTSDERLALYDFAVTSTKGPPQVPEFNIEPKIEEKHNLTPKELEALERDAKRRRIKYKTKSVHTNSKSATEILREIIDGQMEQYEDWIKTGNKHPIELEKIDIDEKNDSSNEIPSPRSSRSQNSYKNYRNSREKSRSPSRKRERKREKYERREYSPERRKYEERGYDRRKYESRRCKSNYSKIKSDH